MCTLSEFITHTYRDISNIGGDVEGFVTGRPKIKASCDQIIGDSKSDPFIDPEGASVYKEAANVSMHILYAAPLETPIVRRPLCQFLKYQNFKVLATAHNHQNAIIAICYGMYLIDEEKTLKSKIHISCHAFTELVQALCRINIQPNDGNMYDSLIMSTRYLALLFEQAVYKTNPEIEYSDRVTM